MQVVGNKVVFERGNVEIWTKPVAAHWWSSCRNLYPITLPHDEILMAVVDVRSLVSAGVDTCDVTSRRLRIHIHVKSRTLGRDFKKL